MSALKPTAARQAVVLAVGSLLISGCGSTPAGGDPGGRRLNALASDQVLGSLPDGATMVGTRKTKAHYRKPGFSGGGWDGPSVVVTFTSSAPPADVYKFYAQRAETDGWHATAEGSLGVTDRWAKTFPDDAPATLMLSRLGNSRYLLTGSIAPVAT
jgi:hypothetical protein